MSKRTNQAHKAPRQNQPQSEPITVNDQNLPFAPSISETIHPRPSQPETDHKSGEPEPIKNPIKVECSSFQLLNKRINPNTASSQDLSSIKTSLEKLVNNGYDPTLNAIKDDSFAALKTAFKDAKQVAQNFVPKLNTDNIVLLFADKWFLQLFLQELNKYPPNLFVLDPAIPSSGRVAKKESNDLVSILSTFKSKLSEVDYPLEPLDLCIIGFVTQQRLIFASFLFILEKFNRQLETSQIAGHNQNITLPTDSWTSTSTIPQNEHVLFHNALLTDDEFESGKIAFALLSGCIKAPEGIQQFDLCKDFHEFLCSKNNSKRDPQDLVPYLTRVLGSAGAGKSYLLMVLFYYMISRGPKVDIGIEIAPDTEGFSTFYQVDSKKLEHYQNAAHAGIFYKFRSDRVTIFLQDVHDYGNHATDHLGGHVTQAEQLLCSSGYFLQHYPKYVLAFRVSSLQSTFSTLLPQNSQVCLPYISCLLPNYRQQIMLFIKGSLYKHFYPKSKTPDKFIKDLNELKYKDFDPFFIKLKDAEEYMSQKHPPLFKFMNRDIAFGYDDLTGYSLEELSSSLSQRFGKLDPHPIYNFLKNHCGKKSQDAINVLTQMSVGILLISTSIPLARPINRLLGDYTAQFKKNVDSSSHLNQNCQSGEPKKTEAFRHALSRNFPQSFPHSNPCGTFHSIDTFSPSFFYAEDVQASLRQIGGYHWLSKGLDLEEQIALHLVCYPWHLFPIIDLPRYTQPERCLSNYITYLKTLDKNPTPTPDQVYTQLPSDIDTTTSFAIVLHPNAHYEQQEARMNYETQIDDLYTQLKQKPPVTDFLLKESAVINHWSNFLKVLSSNKKQVWQNSRKTVAKTLIKIYSNLSAGNLQTHPVIVVKETLTFQALHLLYNTLVQAFPNFGFLISTHGVDSFPTADLIARYVPKPGPTEKLSLPPIQELFESLKKPVDPPFTVAISLKSGKNNTKYGDEIKYIKDSEGAAKYSQIDCLNRKVPSKNPRLIEIAQCFGFSAFVHLSSNNDTLGDDAKKYFITHKSHIITNPLAKPVQTQTILQPVQAQSPQLSTVTSTQHSHA